MADGESPFDRVSPPDPARRRPRDLQGKEALYSTAPTASPSTHLLVVCERCDVESGLNLWEARKLLRPPFLPNPLRRRLWGRCPACERRAWLHIRPGQALMAFLSRG